jgi:hypothetical protein
MAKRSLFDQMLADFEKLSGEKYTTQEKKEEARTFAEGLSGTPEELREKGTPLPGGLTSYGLYDAPDEGGEDTVAGEMTLENSHGDDYFDYFFDEVEVDEDSEDAYA